MEKKARPKVGDPDQIVNEMVWRLKTLADKCSGLAQILSNTEGTPLTPEDKELLRMAVIPEIRSRFNMAAFHFMNGDMESMSMELDNATAVMAQSDLS